MYGVLAAFLVELLPVGQISFLIRTSTSTCFDEIKLRSIFGGFSDPNHCENFPKKPGFRRKYTIS